MDALLTFAALRTPLPKAGARLGADDLDGLREHIFRLCFAMTLNYALAEDLAQECLIRVWRNRDQMRLADSPSAWVSRVVVNRVRSHWRRTRTWVPLLKLSEVPAEPDPQLAELNMALDKLPRDLHELVVLVAVYGATYAEAAQTLGIPEGTVASRYSRARELLRAALEDSHAH